MCIVLGRLAGELESRSYRRSSGAALSNARPCNFGGFPTQPRASDWRGRHSALRATGLTSGKAGIHISPPSKCPAERPGKPDSVSPTIPLGKFPDGRQSIQNASFTTPHRLDCGEQRNDFWGQWLLPGGKLRKNSLDSRSRWGILADIEFWSKARSSQNLDLGTISILQQGRQSPAFHNRFQLRDGLAGSREGSSREVSSLPVLRSRVFSG